MPQQGLVSKGMVLRGDSGHHYTLTRKLGEGQFAEVWEGRQSGSGNDLRVRGGDVSDCAGYALLQADVVNCVPGTMFVEHHDAPSRVMTASNCLAGSVAPWQLLLLATCSLWVVVSWLQFALKVEKVADRKSVVHESKVSSCLIGRGSALALTLHLHTLQAGNSHSSMHLTARDKRYTSKLAYRQSVQGGGLRSCASASATAAAAPTAADNCQAGGAALAGTLAVSGSA